MGNKANSEENLNVQLDRVNNWINNCDQKSGILLTLLGVLFTILMTSDFINQTCDGANCIPLFGKIVLFIIMAVLCISFLYAIVCFLLVLTPRKKPSHISKELENEVEKSLLYFDVIKESNYSDYCSKLDDDNYKYSEDLLTQIYVNSTICSKKFCFYGHGFISLIVFLIFFLALIIFKFIVI